MLSAWVGLDIIPDTGKAKSHKIGCVFVDPRSANAAQAISVIRAAGLEAGIYESPGWPEYGNPTPAKFASIVSGHANQLIPRLAVQAPPLMFDFEGVAKGWIASAVTIYRKSQPRRPTSFTTMAYQWGDVIPIDACLRANLDWYIQTYDAACDPVDDPEWAMLAIARGYPASMVHTFYSYKRPPTRATDGAIFTLNDLP